MPNTRNTFHAGRDSPSGLAASNEADDAKRLEIIRAKNEGDKLIYGVEGMLRDGGEKVTADERKQRDEKKKELEEALWWYATVMDFARLRG